MMRDVAQHSWIMGCCFPGTLQHITVGSRIRGNTLQPVTPMHHSFIPCVLCSGQMMINAFVLAPMSGKNICTIQCLPAAGP